MWRRWRVLAITAVAIIGIQIAQAAETSNNPAETEEVTVTAEANGSLTSVSPEESSKQKRQVAGGFTIKSADEMKYGALTLGGAINLVPFTGYDAAPFQVRFEGGSYGFFRGDMSGGAVEGQFDEFGAIGFRAREGFREHSRENTEILFADLGYKLSDQVENRFYLTLDRTNRNLPGGLTKSGMEDDPSQANPLAIAQDWIKEWSYVHLADKLTIRTDEIQIDVGAFWFHRDLENRGFFSPGFREGIEMFYSDNFGGNLNFVSRHELFGRRNMLTIGLSPQYEDEPTQNYENIFGHTGATTARGIGSSINVPAYLEDQLYLTPRLSILVGAQAIFTERHFIDEFLTDAAGNQSQDTGIHECQS